MSKRIERVNELIKKELSQIILREIDCPTENTLITITRVDTAPNLIHSKVFISVLPEEKTKEVMKMIHHSVYELQQLLNRRLNMRPIPKIQFYEEKATKEAGRIEELLERIKRIEKK